MAKCKTSAGCIVFATAGLCIPCVGCCIPKIRPEAIIASIAIFVAVLAGLFAHPSVELYEAWYCYDGNLEFITETCQSQAMVPRSIPAYAYIGYILAAVCSVVALIVYVYATYTIHSQIEQSTDRRYTYYDKIVLALCACGCITGVHLCMIKSVRRLLTYHVIALVLFAVSLIMYMTDTYREYSLPALAGSSWYVLMNWLYVAVQIPYLGFISVDPGTSVQAGFTDQDQINLARQTSFVLQHVTGRIGASTTPLHPGRIDRNATRLTRR